MTRQNQLITNNSVTILLGDFAIMSRHGAVGGGIIGFGLGVK